MEEKIIHLTTREELNIYMSPVRQELLRTLRLMGRAMTPKALADKLRISPSSVSHHLKKLVSLGVVEADHQEVINGITATFYREVSVTVRVGLEQGDNLREEREAVVTGLVGRVLQGFLETTRSLPAKMSTEERLKHGAMLSGVMSLSTTERAELLELVSRFLQDHERTAPERNERWEYMVLAYQPEVEQ